MNVSRRFSAHAVFALLSSWFGTDDVLPTRLRCESPGNPPGIDQTKPSPGRMLEFWNEGVVQSVNQIK